jgi:hypothetical protein
MTLLQGTYKESFPGITDRSRGTNRLTFPYVIPDTQSALLLAGIRPTKPVPRAHAKKKVNEIMVASDFIDIDLSMWESEYQTGVRCHTC